MLRLGGERDELGIVADQPGCPTYTGDIASAIFSLIENSATGEYIIIVVTGRFPGLSLQR